MKIRLTSLVNGSMSVVFGAFDEQLFRYLLPPGASLIRFDGSKPGNIVHLRFRFPLKAEWISEITDEQCTANYCHFVDRGIKLPPILTYWKHIHTVRKMSDDTSQIEDTMEYRTSNKFLDLVLYPFMYLAFMPRIWQYKRYFNSYKTKPETP